MLQTGSRRLLPKVLLASGLWMGCLISCFLLGCSKGGGSTAPESAIRLQAARQLGEFVILPAYGEFSNASDALAFTLTTYASDLSETNRTAAEEDWHRAMDVWQRVEVMQVGPLGSMTEVVGGLDLRDEIYPWPSLNLCAVDQMTLDGVSGVDDLRDAPVNARGLGALEYLLFVEDSDNRCSPLAPINVDGSWDALSDSEVLQRRLNLAALMAELVSDYADTLVALWGTSAVDGAFVQEFQNPSGSSAGYGSAQEALNGISDAMFYVDTETKDMKIGEVAGLTSCDTDTCPDARESRFANRSKEHIRQNLVGFRSLFFGGEPGSDGVGFDDLLDDMGASDFRQSMGTHIDGAIAAVDAIDGTLVAALGDDLQSVRDAHSAIRLMTDDLKTMFLSVLDLEAPNRAAGDND